MLDGWYCRTLASQQSSQNENDDDNEPNVVDESDESQDIPSVQIPNTDHKAQYIALKKKLKFLLYVSLRQCIFLVKYLQSIFFKLKHIFASIGEWILSRCIAVKSASFIESNTRSIFSLGSFNAIWEARQFWFRKRWYWFVGRRNATSWTTRQKVQILDHNLFGYDSNQDILYHFFEIIGEKRTEHKARNRMQQNEKRLHKKIQTIQITALAIVCSMWMYQIRIWIIWLRHRWTLWMGF